MIEKIKSEIEKLTDGYEHSCVDNAYQRGVSDGVKWIKKKAIEIVQEVVKEYDWVPVDQKTPEDFTFVYATCISLVDNRKPWVIEGVYHSVTGWEEFTHYLSLGKAKVIAWMPKKMPAPYQKGEPSE